MRPSRPLLTHLSLSVLTVACLASCDSSNPAQPASAGATGEDVSEWVARGPGAWAEHLAAEANVDEDGFPRLVALSRWIDDNPPDAVESERLSEWIAAYADLIRSVAERRGWSGEVIYDQELFLTVGERIGVGLSSGDAQVTNKQLIAIVKGGAKAIEALRATDTEEARILSGSLVAFGERLGRNGADEEFMIAVIQLNAAARAVEQLIAIAGSEGDDAEQTRLETVQRELKRYGERLMQARRGG